ncbi:MAG: hypothetical protein LBT61_03150, partial [Prevotellaceae bacterium]|nr:hypothetical protein [Prevotellaceae bacterium]
MPQASPSISFGAGACGVWGEAQCIAPVQGGFEIHLCGAFNCRMGKKRYLCATWLNPYGYRIISYRRTGGQFAA